MCKLLCIVGDLSTEIYNSLGQTLGGTGPRILNHRSGQRKRLHTELTYNHHHRFGLLSCFFMYPGTACLGLQMIMHCIEICRYRGMPTERSRYSSCFKVMSFSWKTPLVCSLRTYIVIFHGGLDLIDHYSSQSRSISSVVEIPAR